MTPTITEVDGIPRLQGLQIGDDPDAWHAAGFAVDGDRFSAGGVTIELTGADGPRGLLAWSLEHPEPFSVDGLSHVETIRPGSPAEHRNGASAVDHVVVSTPNVQRTTDALDRLGITPRRTVQGGRGRDLVYRFFLLGTCLLEVIGPREPSGDDPARFAGIAFTAPDLRTVADVTGAAGAARDAVQPGRRIVSLGHRQLGISVPVAFLTPRT